MTANADRIVLGPVGDLSGVTAAVENPNEGALAKMRQDSDRSCATANQPVSSQARVEVNPAWTDSMEKNLIANVGEAVARANILAEPEDATVLTVDQLRALHPASDYWHADNRTVNEMAYVSRDRTAVQQDLHTMCAGILTLDDAINKISMSKQPLTVDQKDRLRQMAENGAMLTLALAQWQSRGDTLGARTLISRGPGSVESLLDIARANGANPANIRQIRTMARAVVDTPKE